MYNNLSIILLIVITAIMYRQALAYFNVMQKRGSRAIKLAIIATVIQIITAYSAVNIFKFTELFQIISVAGIFVSAACLGLIIKQKMVISHLAAYCTSTAVTIGSTALSLLILVNLIPFYQGV